MRKDVKIFIFGLLITGIVAIYSIFYVSNLNNEFKDIEALCIQEKYEKTMPDGFTLICDPSSLDYKSVGIQKELYDAHHKIKQSGEWAVIVCISILFVSALPVVWYFFLARIRELREAIIGK